MSETEVEVINSPLMDIKGIGPKTAEKLIEVGRTTIEQIAVMKSEELADVLKITNKAAKDIVNSAKNIALDKAVKLSPMQELIEHRKTVVQRISTGSAQWDKIMKGGIPTEAISVLVGEYASGKSQSCYQLVVNCIKNQKRKAVWIETESGTFVPDRIMEMAKAVGLDIDPKKDIFYIGSDSISTTEALFLAYERVAMEMAKGNLDAGILIIDSFSHPFRSQYIGREMLPDRSKETSRHLGFLDQIAKRYNMAVVLTCQVMDIPDAGAQLGERVKSGSTKRAFGGNVLLHGGTYLIHMEQKATVKWEGVVFDAPDIPRSTFYFKIAPQGIRDA